MLRVNAQPQSKLKDRGSHQLMGKPVPRRDIPGKVTGGVAYVHDLRLPGMLHARVVRPPSYDAKLRGLDMGVAKKVNGVVDVVQRGRFIAVVATSEFAAVRAMRALSDAAQWDETVVPAQAGTQGSGPAIPTQAAIYDHLLKLPSQDTVIASAGTPAAGAGAIEAT
jgi:hypothetical protein